MVSFAVVSVLIVAVVTLQTFASQSSFRVEELTGRIATLREERDRLSLEVAELWAPGRITKHGKRLGLELIPPENLQTITVRAMDPARQGSAAPAGDRP